MVRVLVLLFLALTMFFQDSPVWGEQVDRIVAIVNDEIITLSELEIFRKAFYPETPSGDDWLSRELDLVKVQQKALNALINDKLIEQEAERQQITISDEQIEQTVDSVKQEQGLTQDQLEIMLKTQGLTYEKYKTELEKTLKRTKMVKRAVKSNVEINDENLERYYRTHIQGYMADPSIRISHILLPLSPNPTSQQEDDVLSLAQEIKRRADRGEAFATLAQEYAGRMPEIRTSDLGYFKKGEMIPALEEEAFGLEVDEVGEPVRTPQGIVLIRVTDRKASQPIPLEKIRERVEVDYYTSEVERRYQAWIDKLREKAVIEVKL
jgi:peptidyl-prolyl cis-trans isomerase SurA